MGTVTTRLEGLAQLLRIKPVASWGVSAFLLGVAVAYARAGPDLSLVDGALALVLVVLAQGFVSHGLNDAVDWITGTDKESVGKGTGGSRVIPEGKMTVYETYATALVALVGVIGISAYFFSKFGMPMLALAGIAIWAPVSYSIAPLKLGYRPFNEIVVVLPAIAGVVVGTDLVLSGSWSGVAVLTGWVHALFCIGWFIVSRVPDYEPDKRVGKITSVVWVGRENTKLLSASYLALALAAVPYLFATVSWAFVVTPIAWAFLMLGVSRLDPYDPEQASAVRLKMMHTTTIHAIVLSVMLAFAGGL